MRLLLFICSVSAASHHVERCKSTLQPALENCHGDRDCRCGVLARAGQLCLKSAPPGSLLDLIRSVDDGDCMRTHFMEINSFDNLLNTDHDHGETGDYNGAGSVFSQERQDPICTEDIRDQNLAEEFVEWVNSRLDVVHKAATNETAPVETSQDSSPITVQPMQVIVGELVKLLSLLKRFFA